MSYPSTDGVEPSPIHRPTFVGLTVVFTITALLLFLIGVRLQQRGRWLPALPDEVRAWVGARKDVARIALEQLGAPRSQGVEYVNAFGEKIQAQVFSTNDFEAYLDPKAFMAKYRFGMTAQKGITLFGKDGAVRALVFRGPDSESRVLMYYWLQYRDGHTSITDSLIQKEDFLTRLRLGAAATVQGSENCVVRVFTDIPSGDREGIQTRRNIEEVSLAIHEALKTQKETAQK